MFLVCLVCFGLMGIGGLDNSVAIFLLYVLSLVSLCLFVCG